ncbi:hypothetical protein OIV83_001522 [Microbotryomycetes sp. JL201]|nr:hypothetical protein OIV83_001522 [Microbotryomycetes sp. JL201]
MLPPPLCPLEDSGIDASVPVNWGQLDGPASVPLLATKSNIGRHIGRASSVRSSSARFNPLHSITHDRSQSTNDIPVRPDDSTALVPSILLQLSAATPLPASPELSASKDGSLTRSNSSIRKQRTPRRHVVEDSTMYRKNTQHLFAVHIQTKAKAEVTEEAVLPLLLAFETPGDLPLARAALAGEPYTAQMFQLDCRSTNSYTFVAPAQRQTWTVRFSQFGPQAVPQSDSALFHKEVEPIYTFIHFLPQDVVIQPAFPIGSRHWW